MPRRIPHLEAEGRSQGTLRVLDELRELPNFAVHNQEFEPTASSVLRYVDLAKTLQLSLENKLKLLQASQERSVP